MKTLIPHLCLYGKIEAAVSLTTVGLAVETSEQAFKHSVDNIIYFIGEMKMRQTKAPKCRNIVMLSSSHSSVSVLVWCQKDSSKTVHLCA